jgi:phosphoribosylglycinamide formyltransferase 1
LTHLGVLVSGRGSNLAAILRACRDGDLAAEVAIVASNKPGCAALEVAREAGVPVVQAFTLGDHGDLRSRDAAIADALKLAGVDVVVTAGYDRVLDEGFVAAFEGRILNLHPSLLPAFAGGMNAIADALDASVSQTGVTVHLIEPHTLDGGRILAQEAIEVWPDDTLESLSLRVHEVEHRLLPAAIKAFIETSLVR